MSAAIRALFVRHATSATRPRRDNSAQKTRHNSEHGHSVNIALFAAELHRTDPQVSSGILRLRSFHGSCAWRCAGLAEEARQNHPIMPPIVWGDGAGRLSAEDEAGQRFRVAPRANSR